MNRIVLAYSGDLDSSIAISWLADTYRADVVTVTVDVGQGGALEDVRDRALGLGAARAHVIDARESFARDFVWPALSAGAIVDGGAPLGDALVRMIVAKHLAAVATLESATAVAHASANIGPSTGGLPAMDMAIRAIDPGLPVLAVTRAWTFTPTQKIEYAQRRGIPIPRPTTPEGARRSLWARSFRLEDPSREVPEHFFALTKSAEKAADRPVYVDIEFEHGVPVAANGVTMSPFELIASLDTIASAHGVGRFDVVGRDEDQRVVRDAGEAPAAAVLGIAHLALRRLVTSRDLERLSTTVGQACADAILDGQWFSPARDAIAAFAAKVQERVAGVIRLKLFKGQCRVVGRQSPFALSEQELAAADRAALVTEQE